jgi:hypothetical protein
MTQTEALLLVLEALEDLGMKHYENTGEVLYKETFTAIKAALEAKDEPVAKNEEGRITWLVDNWPQNCLLYTTPPQRTWVTLTDEEISDCMEMSIQKTCRAIEAKLKEKNT